MISISITGLLELFKDYYVLIQYECNVFVIRQNLKQSKFVVNCNYRHCIMFEVKGDYVFNLIRLDISYQIIG